MKKIAYLFGFLLMVGSAISQEGRAPLSMGERQLNFGLGISGNGLPTYGGVDFAFHDDWTAGPMIKLVLDDDISFGALGRVDYHWNRLMEIPSVWDFYLGANIGFISGDDFDLDLGLQVGGRWYWSNTWALNIELGGGTGYNTSVGVSMKF